MIQFFYEKSPLLAKITEKFGYLSARRDIEIIEQRPVTLTELKNRLVEIKKEKKELKFRAEKVYTYAQDLISGKDTEELHKKLSSLGIQKLRERHITKIIDMLPEDADSLKAVFIGETTTLKAEEVKQIIDTING